MNNCDIAEHFYRPLEHHYYNRCNEPIILPGANFVIVKD